MTNFRTMRIDIAIHPRYEERSRCLFLVVWDVRMNDRKVGTFYPASVALGVGDQLYLDYILPDFIVEELQELLYDQLKVDTAKLVTVRNSADYTHT